MTNKHQWDHFILDNFPFILDECRTVTKDTLADKILANHGNREVEHQAGRYINMREIADEIMTNNIPGDILEFGVFKGLSLMMLAQTFASDTAPRKFIGIDSFEGLPLSSTIWNKGTFSDTSAVQVDSTVTQYFPNNPCLSCSIIKGWFKDPHVAQELYNHTESISMVHFDADLAVSTTEALTVIEHYLINRKDPIFFLFDDWGLNIHEVPAAWNSWYPMAQQKFNLNAKEISGTSLTKNFRLTFNF